MSHSATTPAPATGVFRLPRRPKAVVFDLDGTLIDSESLVLEAYMAAARRHGKGVAMLTDRVAGVRQMIAPGATLVTYAWAAAVLR